MGVIEDRHSFIESIEKYPSNIISLIGMVTNNKLKPISSTTKQQVNKLLGIFDKDDHLLILIQPDPDSIASSMALKRLLWRRISKVTIAYYGEIQRLEAGEVRGVCYYAIDMVTILREMLLYRDGVSILQRVADRVAEDMIKDAVEQKDGDVAKLLNELGFDLDTLGEPKKAIEYYEKALAILLKVYGENHPDTKSVIGNLAYIKQSGKA